MPFGLALLLFENRLLSSTSSSCNTRSGSPRTTKWRNGTEHATVPKDRIYCSVHPVDLSSMLSAVQYSFSDSYKKRILPISSRNLGIYNNSCLLKLVFKPDSLFLEDQRGETRSKEHDQADFMSQISFNTFFLSYSLI